jgi:polysaccharide export outer membrane protein
VQSSAKGDEPELSSAGALADYRLAPGDRLTIVVVDQPQLSGEYIVDGGGSVLLPMAGSASVSGLTLTEAQQLIRDRFADGVLVAPAVSVRIIEYRPVFVSGRVRKPGSYPFTLGVTVKAAIATAGGVGLALEVPETTALSDYITAQQRVRQLEADHATLLMRKARLEVQRDGREDFVPPMLVGLSPRNVDFDRAYSAENDTFLRLGDTHRGQIEALQMQRPRIEAEIKAVRDQIAKQNEHLGIVLGRLRDLELLFGKGLLRKEVLINQQIEKSLIEAQLSNLEAQVARLRQNMGDLDVRLVDLKAAHEKQTLAELQDASQRLLEIENSIGPARRILGLRAEGAIAQGDEPDYTVKISRVRDGRMIIFDASDETVLSPGDVVEVKVKRRDAGELPSSTQAVRILDTVSPVVEGTQSAAK